jgi:nitrogen fixation NifU-like protein
MTEEGAVSSDVDKFVLELQEEIMRDVRRKYSPTVIEHWMNPTNFRRMEDFDGYGRVTGSCGDTMEVFIRIAGGRLSKASFFTDGCGTTIACGSVIVSLAQGKTTAEALGIGRSTVLKTLGGLPQQDEHCAELAANALQYALIDYLTAPGSSRRKGCDE